MQGLEAYFVFKDRSSWPLQLSCKLRSWFTAVHRLNIFQWTGSEQRQ